MVKIQKEEEMMHDEENTSDENFNNIMESITSKLTGNDKEDIPYLLDKIDEYKGHKYETEINRACWRIIYKLTPYEMKKKFEKIIDNHQLSVKETLEEAEFNIYKKRFDVAAEMLGNMVYEVEQEGLYKDDAVSEYHHFDEPMAYYIYTMINKLTKTLRELPEPLDMLYFLYGSVLFELEKFEEAKLALTRAKKYNPTSADIAFEYAEIFKKQGDMEEYRKLTLEIFKISFRAAQVARCYRNLGYYYIEKEQWDAAIACYTMSIIYGDDKGKEKSQNELFYIQTKTGIKSTEFNDENIKKCSEKYDFPVIPDGEIMGLSMFLGEKCAENHNNDMAIYFYGIAYELTMSDEIREKLEKLQAESGVKNEQENKEDAEQKINISHTSEAPTDKPPEPEPSPEENNYAKTIFLWTYQGASPVLRSAKKYHFDIVYLCGRKNPREFHKNLIEEGYFVEAPMKEKLDYLKVADLKKILKDQGLHVSGKKVELVERLIDNCDENRLNRYFKNKIYVLSDKGEKFVGEHDDYIRLYKHPSWNIKWQTLDGYKKDGFNFHDAVLKIFNERISRDKIFFGKYHYYDMYTLLEEEGYHKAALSSLLRALCIDLSGINRKDELPFNVLPNRMMLLLPEDGVLETVDRSFMLYQPFIRGIESLKDYYDESMVDQLYDEPWLPFSLCDKETFKMILGHIFSDKFDADEVREIWKKSAHAKAKAMMGK